MKKILLLLLLSPVFGFGQGPILTMISDGDCSGGNPKVVEIYANGTVDFSLYSIELQTNANTTWGNTESLASLGTLTDEFAYVYLNSGAAIFATEYPNATNTYGSPAAVNFNGDDRVRIILTSNSTVIDQYGQEGIDGSGLAWEYLDGYSKRITGTGPDPIFNSANWTYNNQVLDGQGSCQGGNTFESIIGIGTYTTGSAGCNLSAAGLANTSCNDDGTSTDPVDDYITFDLNPTGTDLGTTYSVSVPTGTITPTTGTYGIATSFELQGGSAGAGNVTVTITDDVDGGCTLDQVITDPGVCSSATPDITVNPTLLTGFTHIVGTPSAEQSFTVSGLALTDDIIITAPTNYEISLTTGTGFTNVINLTPATGTVANTTVYVRENATVLGTYNEIITITSTGATDEAVNLEGTANDYVDFTIDEINDLDGNGVGTALNTLVELTGVVHCMDFDGNAGYSFTIIDNSGKGINVFRTTDIPNYTNPVSGDSILVRGIVLQFNGLLEVEPDSINLLATGVELITPVIVTTLDESTESNYITLENLTFVTPITTFPTGSTNIDVTDGTNTYVLRIDSDTDIPGTPAPQYTFNVTGIGGQFDSSSPYDSGYQLFPCGTSSFIPSCSAPDVSVSVAGYTITAGTTGPTITYQWIDCADESEINGETSASFTPAVDGDYAVIITDEVCSDTSVCTTIAGLSIAKNELSAVVNVYPNPVQNELTISNTSNTTLAIQVLDINGKIIFETISDSAKTAVETTSWNKGIYFIEVSNGNATITHKVVK